MRVDFPEIHFFFFFAKDTERDLMFSSVYIDVIDKISIKCSRTKILFLLEIFFCINGIYSSFCSLPS